MSYESALQELIAQGIIPSTVEEYKEQNEIDPMTKQILDTLEAVNGNKFSEEQKRILTHKGNMCIIACAGSGKALANGTGVLTETGYVPIEELKVYDKVFSETGEPEIVLGVFPQGEKRVYKLTMNDGHVIKCCEDHLWTIKQSEIFETRDDKKEFVSYYKTVSTKELYEEYRDVEVQLPSVDIEKSYEEYNIYDKLFKHTREEIIELMVKEGLSTYSNNIEGFGNPRHWTKIELLMTADKDWDGRNEFIRVRNKELIEDMRMAIEVSGYHCKIEVKADEKGSYTEFTILPHLESSIVCVEKTNEFAEMTCIKVSGKTELFLTEHCYVTHNTTILTNLIAKRIASGEIKDVTKVVCTTYSKGGATEMEDRLHVLLQKLGYNYKIKVMTLHAFFLSIIRAFGINMTIISEGERLRFIAESAKEAGVELRDDDLANLSNLISFQLNNLMVDKKALESEANTLNNLTLENYAKIRNGYAMKKYQKQMMDFDDMQLYLYKWIVKDKTSENEIERNSAVQVRNYCKALYNDFYIDEAQDLSKIQFAIVREMLADPDNKNKLDKNLVFVGDDSQCLVEGTEVYVGGKGLINIEDVAVGDKVLSACGCGNTNFYEVDAVSSKEVNEIIYEITTKYGNTVKATGEHIGFSRLSMDKLEKNDNNKVLELTLFDGNGIKDGVKASRIKFVSDDKSSTDISGSMKYVEDVYNGLYRRYDNKEIVKRAKLTKDGLSEFKYFKDLQVGDYIPVSSGMGVVYEPIMKIKKKQYIGRVYDLSVPDTRNFIANGVVVHNCIYKWRGADPSIILNIGNTFDIDILMLSTNYRCKENIVNFAANSILHTSVIYPKEMKAFNKGGNIKIAVAEPKKDDLLRLSKIALGEIKRLMEKGENPNDICVMSRNNFHLAILSNMLLREGIYTQATNEMKLTNSTLYKDLKLIFDCCEDNYDVSITRQVLFKLIKYMSAANSKIIADVQDSAGLTLRQTLGYMLKTFERIEVNEERQVKVPPKAEKAIELKWHRLSRETIRGLAMLYQILCEKDTFKKIKGLYTMYIETAGELFYKREDKNRSLKGLCNYMALMVQESGYQNTKDFLRMTEQLEQGGMAITGDKVTLTTVHSAKGKEWKNVIAFAVDNVSMPSVDSLKEMVKNCATMNEINEYIDEERRLYYVEMTRAKENLLIITSSIPSLFLMESLDGLCLAEGDTSNMVMLDAISGDSYVSANQYNKLFRKSVINEKLLNEESEYYYKID